MVKTCIVCKKEHVPRQWNYTSRSFHKFPHNSELKKKWMDAIGVSAISKTTAVCSDHFDNSAFHDTGGYTTIRRLLSTAVPRNIKDNQPSTKIVKESDLNTLQNIINLEHTYALSTGSSNNTDIVDEPLQTSDSEKLISTESTVNTHQSCESAVITQKECESAVNTQQSCKSAVNTQQSCKSAVNTQQSYKIAVNTQQSCKSAVNTEKSCKRKAGVVDMSVTRKRVKFGFQTEWFSRTDFTTVEAWTRFLRFLRQVKLGREASAKSKRRAQSKLNSYKELVKILKKREMSKY